MKATVRSNIRLLGALRAIAIGALTWLGMTGLHAQPSWLVFVLAVLVGFAALANAELGVLVALIALCIPVLALNLIVGVCLAVVLVSAEHYLGGGGATNFLLFGLALIGAFFGPVWAAAALAGYLLGPAEGAIAAIVACLLVEGAGVLTARTAIGAAFTGGAPHAILAVASAPSTLLSSGWIAKSFAGVSASGVEVISSALGHIGGPVVLLIQAVFWALGAIVAGLVMRRASERARLWMPVASVSAGVLVVWAGDAVTRIGTHLPLGSPSLTALVTSLLVAALVVLARETIFAAVPAAPAHAARPISMAAEDADVDELLRLIATAEDKLASQHTSRKVVLITDMKSFSRMTEEDGSVASAKAIQRHRDILVPIVSANNGCGKSTGGDGVVAAFESGADAIRAAAEGQRALVAHNASHVNEREIWVRMGLAFGEVVLDNGGRPFIGAGLNLAARVMNLADGGQIFAAADVAKAAAEAGTTAHSFGRFELKNIANPVEIAEILWAEGQQPHDPRETPPAE